MEEKINLITSAEANKYIWQNVKQLLTAKGLIVVDMSKGCLLKARASKIRATLAKLQELNIDYCVIPGVDC